MINNIKKFFYIFLIIFILFFCFFFAIKFEDYFKNYNKFNQITAKRNNTNDYKEINQSNNFVQRLESLPFEESLSFVDFEIESRDQLSQLQKKLIEKTINNINFKMLEPSEILDLGFQEPVLQVKVVFKINKIDKSQIKLTGELIYRDLIEKDQSFNKKTIELQLYSKEEYLNKIPDLGQLIFKNGKLISENIFE